MTSRTSKVLSLSLAQGILMLVNIISGMVFARSLSVADYGTYLQTFLAYDFAVPLLTLGLPSALYYFLPGANERQKGLIIENMMLLFIAALIFSLFLMLGGTNLLAKRFNNPDLEKTLRWMVFYPLYTFPVLISGAVWVIKDKVKLSAVYNLVTGLILTISLIIAAWLSKSYILPVLVRIVIPLLFLPIALLLIFKSVSGGWYKPSFLSTCNMAKFAVPLGLASVFGTLAIQLAGVIVSLLTTKEDYAIYATGAKEVPFIGIITGSIAVVIMAEMSEKIKSGDTRNALELFRKAASVSAGFLFPVMVFLLIFAESFIDILYSDKYADSVIPFRIYLFIIPIRIAYYGSAFIAFGKTKVVLLRSIFDLILTALFCYLFVIWFGAFGAALGLILTLFIWSVPYNLILLSKLFKCKPLDILPFKKIGLIIIVSLISGLLPSVLLCFGLSSFVVLFLGAILYGFIYLIIAYHFNDEFKMMAQPYLEKIWKR